MSIPMGSIIAESGRITVFVQGKPYVFEKDNPTYEQVVKAVKEKNEAEIIRLGDLPKFIENWSGSGLIKVENGMVYYKNRVIHNTLTKRILDLIRDRFPFDSMLKFLENLMSNPDFHSVNELYKFLVHRNLPITESGCFLAYKAVKDDYFDFNSGKYRNMIGDSPEMERNEVDSNWRLECSSGFHIGAIEYVEVFQKDRPRRIMIVECNPKDVVSVPEQDSFQKCRTCKYTVVGEMSNELIAQVYKTTSTSFTPSTPMGGEPWQPKDEYPRRYAESNDEHLDDDDDDDDELDDDLDDDEEEEDDEAFDES